MVFTKRVFSGTLFSFIFLLSGCGDSGGTKICCSPPPVSEDNIFKKGMKKEIGLLHIVEQLEKLH